MNYRKQFRLPVPLPFTLEDLIKSLQDVQDEHGPGTFFIDAFVKEGVLCITGVSAETHER